MTTKVNIEQDVLPLARAKFLKNAEAGLTDDKFFTIYWPDIPFEISETVGLKIE